MCLRVDHHVILDFTHVGDELLINVDGNVIKAYECVPFLAAILNAGIKINRYTVKRKEPRGLFCGIGQCTDCAMVVDGKANVRTCITPVKAGMVIKTQDGLAKGE